MTLDHIILIMCTFPSDKTCNSHMTTQRQIQLCLLSICAKVSNQMMFLLSTRKNTGVTSGVCRWCNGQCDCFGTGIRYLFDTLWQIVSFPFQVSFVCLLELCLCFPNNQYLNVSLTYWRKMIIGVQSNCCFWSFKHFTIGHFVYMITLKTCNSHMTTQRQIQLCLLSICAKVSNQMITQNTKDLTRWTPLILGVYSVL
jgi:hypothetical protein